MIIKQITFASHNFCSANVFGLRGSSKSSSHPTAKPDISSCDGESMPSILSVEPILRLGV